MLSLAERKELAANVSNYLFPSIVSKDYFHLDIVHNLSEALAKCVNPQYTQQTDVDNACLDFRIEEKKSKDTREKLRAKYNTPLDNPANIFLYGARAFGAVGVISTHTSYSETIPPYPAGRDYTELEGQKVFMATCVNCIACYDGWEYLACSVLTDDMEKDYKEAEIFYVPFTCIEFDKLSLIGYMFFRYYGLRSIYSGMPIIFGESRGKTSSNTLERDISAVENHVLKILEHILCTEACSGDSRFRINTPFSASHGNKDPYNSFSNCPKDIAFTIHMDLNKTIRILHTATKMLQTTHSKAQASFPELINNDLFTELLDVGKYILSELVDMMKECVNITFRYYDGSYASVLKIIYEISKAGMILSQKVVNMENPLQTAKHGYLKNVGHSAVISRAFYNINLDTISDNSQRSKDLIKLVHATTEAVSSIGQAPYSLLYKTSSTAQAIYKLYTSLGTFHSVMRYLQYSCSEFVFRIPDKDSERALFKVLSESKVLSPEDYEQDTEIKLVHSRILRSIPLRVPPLITRCLSSEPKYHIVYNHPRGSISRPHANDLWGRSSILRHMQPVIYKDELVEVTGIEPCLRSDFKNFCDNDLSNTFKEILEEASKAYINNTPPSFIHAKEPPNKNRIKIPIENDDIELEPVHPF